MSLSPNTRLGRYEIRSKLGEGGMGEVYLVWDSQLERTVALKILPDEVASDQQRMQRFIQEAKAASALNHPNILTVYEIGRADSVHYIATELIDGVTLRESLKGGRMKVSEVLEVAMQIASALAAAHAAGIVHRDIKPENIMVRRDGIAKVLDFGIVKLISQQDASTDKEAPTKALLRTEAGMVVGTLYYMSPEQARGLEVDARTDIWSLGCVLYEMITRRAPFGGATKTDVLVSILDKEPTVLARYAKEVPAELERIVAKALAKNREERYQGIKDMALDLKKLKQRLEFEVELERSFPPDEPRTPTQVERAVLSESVTQITPQFQEETPFSTLKTTDNKKRPLILATVALLLLAIGVIGAMVWQRTRAKPVTQTNAAPQPAAPLPERVLNYSLTVQKFRDGQPYQKPFILSGEINFEKDYRVRLNVRSPQEGYLYIINEGPGTTPDAPAFNVLFPSTTANNGSALIARNQQIQIPQQSWFQFDAEEGTELIWLVWAAQMQPTLEMVKGLANPRDRGEMSDPVQAQAVKEFLKTGSATPPEVKKDDDKKETSITVKSKILVYVVKLEHH
ncbi:MAG: protein kinase [Acidobacteria bacterium]|nr:protein kinase [Acidobacteriota bacterium]